MNNAERLDAAAAIRKIERLAAALAAVCEDYGLDVPEGCDGTAPLLPPAPEPSERGPSAALLPSPQDSSRPLWAALAGLAAAAPATLAGTAETIRIAAQALRLELERPAALAARLRSFAVADVETAGRLRAIRATAERYEAAAELKIRAAALLETA